MTIVHDVDRLAHVAIRLCGNLPETIAQAGIPYDASTRSFPREAHGEWQVLGVTFTLVSGREGTRRSRLLVSCPVCGVRVSTGKLAQHAIKHGIGVTND